MGNCFKDIYVWELINGYFSTEIVTKIELEDQIFIDSILSAPIIGEEFKQFLDSTFSNLDGNKILTTINIGGSNVVVMSQKHF